MKRRSFLTGGAAAAAASAMARLALSAQLPSAAGRHVWSLHSQATRYVIRLNGPAFTADCYEMSDLSKDEATDQETLPNSAMILEGPMPRPVFWNVAFSHQPDPLTLRLALSAVEIPLEAEVDFEINAATGFL